MTTVLAFMRTLVIDRSAMRCARLKLQLGLLGVRSVFTSSAADSALILVDEIAPDLVFLDAERCYRCVSDRLAEPDHHHALLVALVGRTGGEFDETIARRADEVIAQPVDARTLLSTTETLLARPEARRARLVALPRSSRRS